MVLFRAAHANFRGHRFLEELRAIFRACAKRVESAPSLNGDVARTALDRGDTVAATTRCAPAESMDLPETFLERREHLLITLIPCRLLCKG